MEKNVKSQGKWWKGRVGVCVLSGVVEKRYSSLRFLSFVVTKVQLYWMWMRLGRISAEVHPCCLVITKLRAVRLTGRLAPPTVCNMNDIINQTEVLFRLS